METGSCPALNSHSTYKIEFWCLDNSRHATWASSRAEAAGDAFLYDPLGGGELASEDWPTFAEDAVSGAQKG